MLEGHRRGAPRYDNHWDTDRHPHWSRNFIFDPLIPTPNMSAESQRPNSQPVRRRIGDGFDYRRPIMSQPGEDVIDLTSDASSPGEQASAAQHMPASRRAPPFSRRELIPVDSDDDEIRLPPPRQRHRRPAREPSPDLEFLHSRALPPAARPRPPASFGSENLSLENINNINFARSTGHMLERAMEGIRGHLGAFMPRAPNPNPALNPATTGFGTEGGAQAQGQGANQAQNAQVDNALRTNGTTNGNRHRPQHHNRHVHRFPNGLDLELINNPALVNDPALDYAGLNDMDFTTAAFNLGPPPPARAEAPPRPVYEPPPPARPGYTRSFTDPSQIAICANCDEELCRGDNEVKRQVWVTKCGHVRHPTLIATFRSYTNTATGLLRRLRQAPHQSHVQVPYDRRRRALLEVRRRGLRGEGQPQGRAVPGLPLAYDFDAYISQL